MTRSRMLILWLAALMSLALAVAACGEAAPPAQPTTAPAAPAAPTTAPAAPAAPTTAPAPTSAPATAPTAAPAPTTAPAASAGEVPKPEGYPSRAITLIVPWDAGGSTDVGFRVVAPVLERIIGQSVQVVNRPGAGSQVGVTELAAARPDGYTFGNISAPAVQTIYLDPDRQAAFDAEDLKFTALHVFDPGAIAVRADSPYQTLQQVIDDVKANPATVTASTTGVLGDDHLAILLMQEELDIEFNIVHFTGGAAALTALLGGHTDVQFGNVGDFFTRVQDGSVRVLAVMDTQRNEFLPDVPTVEEAIGTRLVSSSSRGVGAPAETPDEINEYISASWAKAMQDPEVEKRMADSGLTQRYMNPAEFKEYWLEVQQTVERLLPIAKAQQK